MSTCYRMVCHTCKLTLWAGEEINESPDSPGPRRIALYRTEDFDPVAKFLEDHQDHALAFSSESPGFYDGYRELDSDDPLQPIEELDDEQMQWIADHPEDRHPRDK